MHKQKVKAQSHRKVLCEIQRKANVKYSPKISVFSTPALPPIPNPNLKYFTERFPTTLLIAYCSKTWPKIRDSSLNNKKKYIDFKLLLFKFHSVDCVFFMKNILGLKKAGFLDIKSCKSMHIMSFPYLNVSQSKAIDISITLFTSNPYKVENMHDKSRL